MNGKLNDLLRHHGGSKRALAKALTVSRPSIDRWLDGARPGPIYQQVIDMEWTKVFGK